MATRSAKTKKPAKKSAAKASVSAQTRLALDRFLLGLWIERDLLGFLSAKSLAAAPLEGLAGTSNMDRAREGERLRKDLFGRERPDDVEKFEALLRQGVDCVEASMPVLEELQHDLYASSDAVPREDPRAEAMRALADYAMASQVNVAVQEVGRLAEATTDRVSKARDAALEKLRQVLGPFPHLMPKA